MIGPRYAVRPSDGTVERAGVDVVHLPIQDAFTTDVPSIYQPHDLLHLHLPELFSRWEARRREVIYRTHCARAETVVAMTSWGKRDLVERYELPPRRSRWSPGAPCSGSTRPPPSATSSEIRARLSLPGVFLLYPAQTWPHKNHERLLEALALIRERDGRRDPVGLPGRQNGHYRQIRGRSPSSGSRAQARFPGFVSPLELRGLYELAPGWSSRAGSRAGGCPSARPSRRAPGRLLVGDQPSRPRRRRRPAVRPGRHRADRRRACSASGPTRSCGAASPSAAASAASTSTSTGPRGCFAPTTGGSAGGPLSEEDRILLAARLSPEAQAFSR